jgi:hypothetical protein
LPADRTYNILFHSIHDVLKAEKIFKKHEIQHELIPVPRNLSSDCGMCIKVDEEIDIVLPLLTGIEIAGCYSVEQKEYRLVRCNEFGVRSD